jgi:predicted exporter
MDERWLPRAFLFALLLLLLSALWLCRQGWPVSSNLLELLPRSTADAVQQQAEARVRDPLTRSLIVLIGSADGNQAAEQARELEKRWQASGLFTTVQAGMGMDIAAMRQWLLQQRIASLPASERRKLAENPGAWALRRAREIADPFSSTDLVPTAQDWLGLTRQVAQALRPESAMRLDLATDTLQTTADGITWVMVRAQTRDSAFDQTSAAGLAALVQRDQAALADRGMQMLAIGGALYAEVGRAQAIKEGSRIGVLSVLGIILVLCAAFRGWRPLLAFTACMVGLLTGFVACIAIFGSIHVMTLVVSASLIGVVINFPMHWLGKSYGLPDWQAWPAMRLVLPGLSLSLVICLIGYLALVIAPFPALAQIAVFSSAGLLGAYACTVCLLPVFYQNWKPRPSAALFRVAQTLLGTYRKLSGRRAFWYSSLPLLTAFCTLGIMQLNLHDDLRQWLSLPTGMMQQARKIGEIAGFMPGSQFLLVRASDSDELLRRQARVSADLDQLKAQGKLASYQSLNQLVAPLEDQRALQDKLAQFATQDSIWQPMQQMGIPLALVQRELKTLAAQSAMTLETALTPSFAEPWRALWLGSNDQGSEVAGIITLQGLRDTSGFAAIAANTPGAQFIDPSGDLNRHFTATRLKAAELKLASYVLAAVLLLWFLGKAAAWRILAVPLVATLCCLAMLGFLGQPLTLFSLFGLLLISAIGMDYAIFMWESVAGAPASLIGILLAAVFTLCSFGLLALSQTPAIANFGLSVTLGIFFCLLMAPFLALSPEP